MYNVSDAYLEAIKRPVIKYSITGTIGSNNFNAYTIKEGSFQITNQCTDTNELSLGSCAIGQLKATFCDVSIIRNEWLDKVITPSCRVEVSEGQYESVPLGVFTIKQAEQTAEGVQVTAYDNMFKFDKLFDATDKDFDKTGKPYYFLNKICQKCGVTLGMTQDEVNALPNGDNTMYICGVRNGTTDYANDIETYRDALFYLAQACACFATINRLGRLELRPFRQSVTDYISDTDRLAGAEFADYVTSFTGIYVDSLYDGRTTFYGYDLEKLQENLVEYTERKEEEEDVVDEDEADIDEIQEKYDQGQITEEEYAEQMAAATKKLKEDEAKLKATNKYLNWLNKAIAKAQANAQGTIMDLEGNPFLQHRDSSIRSIAKVTTATELRTTIMRRLSKMEYVPFSCSSVFGVHYDLGDRIMFTDGHADDDLGCITAFDWTYNGEYSMYGYGANPDEATVRPKIEKAMKQANENALNRADIEMVEVDDNVPEGSPKPVVVRKRSAASSTGENWVSKVIYIWSYYKYSAGSVPQCGITRVKVSCTSGFALCTYDPGRDVYPGEDENIINGIKRHDLMITFVALQIPMSELDSYELPKIKFECTRVYAPDSEHALDVTPQTFSVPEGQDTMELIGYKTVQDPDDVYLYWRLPIASIQYGAVAHGIATEYSQDSVNFHFNSMNAWTAAGVIFLDTIPDLKPGDVMLPTATSQKETAASVENIARKIAGAGSDESQYVDASFLDEGYVNGAVDVESKTLHEAIGKSIDKVFENLDPNIREIYYNTVEPGSIDYYIKDYFHGGDANRLFEYKTYDGDEHHLTIGSGIPTLFADEYLLDEIINDSHYNLEGPHAKGKVYIRIGDKSSIRLVGEAGEDCSAADNPKFTMGGWGDAMRFLNNDGYVLWASRDSEDDMTQYMEYSLANTEGGKTYSMSFDFHASIITGECDIDTTRPLGILVSTSPSLDSSILDELPLDENVWHDSDPDNMYLSFYKNFQIVTISPEGDMTLEYQHYSFTFTAQAGKDYYIYFITSSFVSEDATNRLRMRVKDFVSSEGVGVVEIKASYQGGPNYAADEWYTMESGSGGGGTSDLDAIEITYADYQLLTPEEKADPDKIYFITDYPSGSMALDDLTDVDITTPTAGQILTYDDTDDEWKNTDVDDVTPTVTEASARANLASGDSLKTIIGKIKKWFSDLKDLAFTAIDGVGSTKYLRGDGTWQAFPTIPTVGDGTLTIQKNGTTVETFTANASSNKTANITVPTKLSDLTDDVVSGNYVKVTNGGAQTVRTTSTSGDTALNFRSNNVDSWVGFRDKDNTFLGSIGVKSDKLPYFYANSTTSRIALTSDIVDEKVKVTKNESSTAKTCYIPFVVNDTANAQKPDITDGIRVYVARGTANSVGASDLYLGNSIAEGTAGNMRGRILVYGKGNKYIYIIPSNPTEHITVTLPESTGTIALTSQITDKKVTPVDSTHPTSDTLYRPLMVPNADPTTNRQPIYSSLAWQYALKNGTASAVGWASIRIGNDIASGTANNMQGYLRLYGANSYYVTLSTTSLTASRDITFPNAGGTIALTSSTVAKANAITTVAGTTNSDRVVFFAYDGDTTKVCYDDDFKYNPSTNNLTVGKINGGTIPSSGAVFTDANVTQTNVTTSENGGRVLFSGTNDDTTRTEGAKKANHLRFSPITTTGSLTTIDKCSILYIGKSSSQSGYIGFYSVNNTRVSYLTAGAADSERITVAMPASTGTLALTGSSSRKVKKNISDMTEDEANKLFNLRPVNYDYINEKKGTDCYGFIAEEVKAIGITDPIIDTTFPTNDDDVINVLGLDYAKFVPYLVKVVQMQQKQIDTMQKQIDELMERVK